jgi:hypothetical protein
MGQNCQGCFEAVLDWASTAEAKTNRNYPGACIIKLITAVGEIV